MTETPERYDVGDRPLRSLLPRQQLDTKLDRQEKPREIFP